MDFAVLGPLRVTGPAGPVVVAGVKERTLLAHLITAVGRTVSTADLIDSLWGDRPPPSAPKSLQTFVLRIRDALEPERHGSPLIVLTEESGYRLAVSASSVDAESFIRLADSGRRSLAAGDAHSAVRSLAAAAALWRGPAYLGFEHTAFGPPAARRLAEIRSSAVTDRLTADLRLGQAGRVVAEVERELEAEPYRERLWALLIGALYADDRQADALAAYLRIRDRLRMDLGIEPGPALQDVHRQVLAQDPALRMPHRAQVHRPGLLVSRSEPDARRRRERHLLSMGASRPLRRR